MCPSAAALAIALGPTNPALIDIEQETLVFRREGISPSLWLLVPTFLLRNAPAWVTPSPSQLYPSREDANTLLPLVQCKH